MSAGFIAFDEALKQAGIPHVFARRDVNLHILYFDVPAGLECLALRAYSFGADTDAVLAAARLGGREALEGLIKAAVQ